jgi:hypothetical protein
MDLRAWGEPELHGRYRGAGTIEPVVVAFAALLLVRTSRRIWTAE